MTANLYEKNSKYHVMLSWKHHGKRKQKSVGTGIPVQGNNRRSAEQKRKEILAEWEDKVASNFKEILFSDYLIEWLEIARYSIEETTYSGYVRTINNQIAPYFAKRKIKLHDLKPHHIQSFYGWKMKTSGVSGNTIRRYHANVHRSLKHAVQVELIRDNPAAKVILPKQEQYVPKFYVAEEMRLMLKKLEGEKIEPPVYLASWFGMRRGEALGIRWDEDVDFNTMSIFVNGVIVDKGEGSREDNLRYKPRAKTGTSIRGYPMPQEVADYLRQLREKQEENRALMGNAYNTQWIDFVCVDAMGNLIHPEYLSRAFPRFLRRHGLSKIKFRELRDSNASILLDKDVNLRLIQGWLGHANIKTTIGYTHLKVGAKRKVVAALSEELA